MGQGDEMELEAQAQIWKYIFSFVDSFTLRSAVELGIPDIIHSQGRPITLSQLSACLPIDYANPDRLNRLMRYLVSIGIFSREHGSADDEDDQEDKFGLTCLSKLLVRKLENNMVPFSMLDFKVLMEPWYHLTWSLDGRASGVTAFERVYGTKFWDYAGQDLEFGEKLNEAMACDTSSTMPTLLQQFNQVFADMSSVVDVGGGTGTAAMAIAKSFPNVKCTVFDHPHVVVDDQSDSGGVAKVSGDMFNFIPRADNLLLKVGA
uniref:Trans-resveratrol di-O-methyltransferase-like n=1 Tax=Nelumbo nucifera TaxID=4432 RepID=A0A822XMT0_NELNU|nr:TPA_asm: hypothetical protein HUJ06_022466 [Nelumbo nucifera]